MLVSSLCGVCGVKSHQFFVTTKKSPLPLPPSLLPTLARPIPDLQLSQQYQNVIRIKTYLQILDKLSILK